jgi:hypothetical protein
VLLACGGRQAGAGVMTLLLSSLGEDWDGGRAAVVRALTL